MTTRPSRHSDSTTSFTHQPRCRRRAPPAAESIVDSVTDDDRACDVAATVAATVAADSSSGDVALMSLESDTDSVKTTEVNVTADETGGEDLCKSDDDVCK